MKFAIIIPARKGSSRLPNKINELIGDLPMFAHVINRANEAGIGRVVMATDCDNVMKYCEKNNIEAYLTDSEISTGTDRIFAVYKKIPELKNYDYIINLQADMPFIAPQMIREIANYAPKSNADIMTLGVLVNECYENPNVVKAVCAFYDANNKLGKALYFSRLPIPYNSRNGYYEHMGIYAFKPEALEKFVNLPQSELEKSEKLEQLRALENNMSIDICIVNEKTISVDSFEDLEAARKIYLRS